MARHTRKAAGLLVPLLVLAIAAGAAQHWVANMLQPVKPGTAQPVTVEVPAGASTRTVADLLYQQHLIKNPTVFRYYARYRKMDGQLKQGEYQLSTAMSPEQILQKLAKGEVVVHRFTVPEGYTIEQIADALAAKQLVDKQRFLKAAAASQLAKAYWPADVHLPQPMEGYLFPATYEYKPGVTEEQILKMMFDQFEKVWTPELRARAKELGLSVHQTMTLAAIIEKEAQVAKERPVIAGLYHNRLKIGMKLDADPTVAYALHKAPGDRLKVEDLQVDSPFNTYKNAGLPPGPIAAPGEASIKAALYPAQHDYWYFVAKEDGSGEHYFATTLTEQDQNIAKAMANAKK